MLELWGMWSTPSLPLFSGLLWPGVVKPDRVLSVSQIELNCVLMLNWITWNRIIFDIETVHILNWIVWSRTVLTFYCVWTKTILIPKWIVWIRAIWLNWIAWNKYFWQFNYVLMLNWIIWYRTDYLYKNRFGIK